MSLEYTKQSSHHTPMSLKILLSGTDIDDLFSRACQLGEYALLNIHIHTRTHK